MPYIQRDGTGKIKGIYANFQIVYAEEYVDSSNTELVQYFADKQAKEDALIAQKESERTDFPTWVQVENAIDNAFTDSAQANIIKKIARPVYTYVKNSVT